MLVGITRLGKPLAGVVHVPFAEPHRTVYGAIGVGTFGANPAPARSEHRVISTSRSRLTPAIQQLIDKRAFDQVIRAGGAGSKGLLTLDGIADAWWYPEPGTSLWDSAAVDAILRASGGTLTDAFGDDIIYDPKRPNFVNSRGVIATRFSGTQHQEFCISKEELSL